MNHEDEVRTMNLVLDIIMIFAIFFAGFYIGLGWQIPSMGLFLIGVLLSQVRVVEDKELSE